MFSRNVHFMTISGIVLFMQISVIIKTARGNSDLDF